MRRSASSPLEWEQAASMGELARPLVHEVNNFLNTIMLQLAAMQPGLPPQFGDDLQVIRRRGKQLAQLVQQWQRQPRCEKPSTRTNLKELLETLVQERSWETEGPEAVLSLVPPDKPLTVAGAFCDVKLLILFLTTALIEGRTNPAVGPPVLQIQEVAGNAVLRVAEQGPGVLPRDKDAIFDTSAPTPYSLRFAACQSLARRFRSRVQAEVNAAGGLTFTIELPLASADARRTLREPLEPTEAPA